MLNLFSRVKQTWAELPPEVRVVSFLLGLGSAIRFPYFFPAVINWDESTLILMGQGLLDGHLPYTQLWDLKPPLSFVAYSLFIAVFGESIVAVRVGGLLVLVASAYLTYLTGRSIWGHRAGLIAAGLCVVFVSATSSGQATMTEIIAILPLVGALALLVVKENNPRVLFAVGVLLAIAGMIRLNLAYVALGVGMLLLFELRHDGGRVIGARMVAYLAGGLLVILLAAMPYMVTGRGWLWVESVFIAPLTYSMTQYSALEALSLHLERGFGVKNALLWVPFVIGMAWLLFRNLNERIEKERRGLILIGVFFGATGWSIVSSGAAHGHYLIQIIPLLALIAGALIARLAEPPLRVFVSALVIIGLIPTAKPLLAQYAVVSQRMVAGQSLPYGTAYEIAAVLGRENPLHEPIYLMTDHIAYWLTDTRPLTRASTHPSNIAKERILQSFSGSAASTARQMSKILAMKPLFIVKKRRTWYLRDKGEARQLLKRALAAHYKLFAEVSGRYIYRRRSI